MSRKNCEISLKVQEIIINHYKEGKTLRSIGEIVGRSHSTIQRIVNLYKDAGDILPKSRSGRPKKLTKRIYRAIIKQVQFKD